MVCKQRLLRSALADWESAKRYKCANAHFRQLGMNDATLFFVMYQHHPPQNKNPASIYVKASPKYIYLI